MHTPVAGRPLVISLAAFVACSGGAMPRKPPPAPPTDTGGSGGTAGMGGGGAPGGAGGAGSGGTVAIDASSGGAGGAVDSAPARPDAKVDIAPATPGDSGPTAPPGPSACPELTAGWMPYTATKTVQFEGGDSFCTYREEGGVEFFKMMKNPAGVVQRCEARVHNDYRTGRNQFEGDVRVTIGDFTCVHQVFKSFMLDAFPANGGELRVYSGSAPVVSGAFGKWVHVNTIHDTASNNIELYIDCARRYGSADRDTPGPNGFYNKYGIYGVLGKPPAGAVAQVEWRNVRYYRK
jgi:hypothetical protein